MERPGVSDTDIFWLIIKTADLIILRSCHGKIWKIIKTLWNWNMKIIYKHFPCIHIFQLLLKKTMSFSVLKNLYSRTFDHNNLVRYFYTAYFLLYFWSCAFDPVQWSCMLDPVHWSCTLDLYTVM